MDTTYLYELESILNREIFSLIAFHLMKHDSLFEMNAKKYKSDGLGYWTLKIPNHSKPLETVSIGRNINNLFYVPVHEGHANPRISTLLAFLDRIRSGDRLFDPEEELVFAMPDPEDCSNSSDVIFSVVYRE